LPLYKVTPDKIVYLHIFIVDKKVKVSKKCVFVQLTAQWRTRVSCALEQDISLRPLSTKTTAFEVKNRCKNAEEVKREHLL